jgi:cell division septum initiation protein DivIVA
MSILSKAERLAEIAEDLVSTIEDNEAELDAFRDENRELKSKVDELEGDLEEFQGDGITVIVNIQSENHIVADWAAEEVARIIKAHGTVKAYEIFKSIK